MKKFNEWLGENEPVTINSLFELAERMQKLLPNFSDIISHKVAPSETHKILEARELCEKAMHMLLKIGNEKDENGETIGHKKIGL